MNFIRLSLCLFFVSTQPLIMAEDAPKPPAMIAVMLDIWHQQQEKTPKLFLAFTQDQGSWKAWPVEGRRAPYKLGTASNLQLKDFGKQNLTINGKPLGSLQLQPSASEQYLVPTPSEKNTQNLISKHFPARPKSAQPQALLTSSRSVSDPDRWTSIQTTVAEDKLALETYHKSHQRKRPCDLEESGTAHPGENTELTKLQDLVVKKRFRDQSGALLIGVFEREVCFRPWDEMQTDWYFIREGKVEQTFFEMRPVDAADFDGDGKSEWVFLKWTGPLDQPESGVQFTLYSPSTKKLVRSPRWAAANQLAE